MNRVMCVALLCAVSAMQLSFAAVPAFVDITWMSISNMYYEIGPLNIVTDGYITWTSGDSIGAAYGRWPTLR